MNINWVISDQAELDPTVPISQLKNIGSIWGSWKTWRSCQTDNVICHDMSKANELIKRAFHAVCNFYISNENYKLLDSPSGVRIYEGNFQHDVDFQDEIIAMHLAASVSDIVLLIGFDFTESTTNPDKLLEHRAHNYRSLTKQVIKSNPNVQWVVVDHPSPFRKDLLELENLTKDSLNSVLGMLSN
jgi:hypothetical protein